MELSTIPIPFKILLFCAAFAAIIKAADYLVEAASRVATSLGMSELVVGLTIVAFGTSAPEFFVTSIAALQGSSGLSLGNIVGSSIFNVGIILALSAIWRGIPVSKALLYRDGSFLLGGIILLSVFAYTSQRIERVEGACLFLFLIGYLGILIRYSKPSRNHELQEESTAIGKDLAILAGSLVILLIGSKFSTTLAIDFARSFGVSEWIIGATIIAAGTSLPELITAIMSMVKSRVDIGLGNIIGSEIFNIMGAIGVASMIAPITKITSITPFIALFLSTVILAIFMRTQWRITRWEGIALFVIGIIRWTLAN